MTKETMNKLHAAIDKYNARQTDEENYIDIYEVLNEMNNLTVREAEQMILQLNNA